MGFVALQPYKADVVLSFPIVKRCHFFSCSICFFVYAVVMFFSLSRSSNNFPRTLLAVAPIPHFKLQLTWSHQVASSCSVTYVSAVHCSISDPAFVFSLFSSFPVMSQSLRPSPFSLSSRRPFRRTVCRLAASSFHDTDFYTFVISICHRCFHAICATS